MQQVFASRAAKPACLPTIFTSRPDRLPFYYFISIGFQAAGFCILGRKTGMPARHFHQSAGPFTILLFYLHWVPGSRFLHLGPQNLHVGLPFSLVGWTFLNLEQQSLHVDPPFSPVGRTVYCFTFYFHSVPGSRFLHLGPQNLHVGPPFIGFQAAGFCISDCQSYTSAEASYLPERFCISGWQPCMSAHVLCMSGRQCYTSAEALHFSDFFCISSRQPFMSAHAFWHVGPPILHVRQNIASPKGFSASRTANPACMSAHVVLHVGQAYPLSYEHRAKCSCYRYAEKLLEGFRDPTGLC